MTTRSVPVPLRLKVRRTWRRLPPVRAVNVLRKVVSHPSNAGRRSSAVFGALSWQARSRVSTAPVDRTVWESMTLRCYPRSNSASNVAYFTERFDPAEMALIEALLEPGDAVMDVGANIGVYTLLLARLVGPSGRVVSVEPGPVEVARLRENVRLNGLRNVDVHAVAAGAATGTALMTVDSDVSNTLTAGPGTHAVATVDVLSLDELAPARLTFVKLDVEGFEHEVLRGATDTLQARPVWQIELTDHLLQRAGSSVLAVTDEFARCGYRISYPAFSGGRVRMNEHGCSNAFAIPTEKSDWVLSRLEAGAGPLSQ